jgi:hypothetical protein
MTERGLNIAWGEKQEETFRQILSRCDSFAERHLILTLVTLMKYDLRTREGKRKQAEARLRISTATDEDLEEMAGLLCGSKSIRVDPELGWTKPELLERLRGVREAVHKRGIRKEELCLG